MFVEEIDVEDIAQNRICAACIGEEFLKGKVLRNGDAATCSYCDKRDNTYTINEIADEFEAVFEDHFYQTSTDPSPFEYAVMNDPESSYDWERDGERVTDVISSTAEIDDEPAEHVRLVLKNRHYDIEAAKMGDESPFESETHYADRGIDDHDLQSDWMYFQQSLKTETRLFNRSAEATLETIFEGINEHNEQPVIVEAAPDHPIATLFRARVFQSDGKLEEALGRPDLHVGSPPSIAALAGRMNARGISMFYGATDPGVALAEVRPPAGSRVVVAKFMLIRPIRLLDVEAIGEIKPTGSLFDPSFITRLRKAKFFRHLSSRITMPVMPDDEPFDYLVTQAIADFLASRNEPQIDGLIYRSVQNGASGRNVVLFNKASRVEALDLPVGTKIEVSLGGWSEDDWKSNPVVYEKLPSTPDEGMLESLERVEMADRREVDVRTPTLRIDTATIEVHEVTGVRIQTSAVTVPRHRTEHRDPEF